MDKGYARAPGNGVGPRQAWAAAGLCALAGFFLFQFEGNSGFGYINTRSLFYWWGFQWINPESETQHGLLILGLAAWLLHRNLAADGPEPGDWSAKASAALVAGVGLHALGFVASQARLSILGLLLFVWGVLALGGGPRWGRSAGFPIAFLVFAIPLSALDSFGFWLRMGVVAASASISHAIGIGVVINGTQLYSPDGTYNYDVAAACSGVRSLVALGALSLLIGYLRFRRSGRRLALLALCPVLIFAGNVVRIVSIIIAARLGGQHWGDRVHEVMGYGVFAIVLGGVYWAGEAIFRAFGDPPPAAAVRRGSGPRDPRALVAAAALSIVSTAGVFAALHHVGGLAARGEAGVRLSQDGREPVELPTFLTGDWIGRRADVTEIERQVLPPDTGYSRKTYVPLDNPSNQVFLSIVLSGRDRTSIHRPELCLVGQGWTIRESFEHRFTYPGTSVTFPATVLQVDRETISPKGRTRVPQLVAYYFVGGGTVVASHWRRILLDSWNRVFHARADRWAYVLLQVGDADGRPAGLGRIQAILTATLPSFQPLPRE